MDTRTGKIYFDDEKIVDELVAKQKSDSIKINEHDLTKKQKQNMQVSLHDRRSKLGKQLTKIRSLRKLTQSEKKLERKLIFGQ